MREILLYQSQNDLAKDDLFQIGVLALWYTSPDSLDPVLDKDALHCMVSP